MKGWGYKGTPGPVLLELLQDLVQDTMLSPVTVRRVVAHPLTPGQTHDERLHPEDLLDLMESRLKDPGREDVELVATLAAMVVLEENTMGDESRHLVAVVLLWTADLDQSIRHVMNDSARHHHLQV